MLVYQATKSEFMEDVERDVLVERVVAAFESRVHKASASEIRSWENSLLHMYKVLNTPRIAGDCGVAVEFGVPYTSSRIDFLLTGRTGPREDPSSREAAAIVELKQWHDAENVPGKRAVVRTLVGRGKHEVTHPSYQAMSYARMIEDYNEAVREAEVILQPCAYLHNYRKLVDDPLFAPKHAEWLDAAPAFTSREVAELREYLCRYVTHSDEGEVLLRIEHGRLRPSKSLQDALGEMLDGNEPFVMIDDQKIVLETALKLARRSRRSPKKQVLIVRGGPGTGKSVIAINLLVQLTRADLVAQYVSRNAAPRNVYSQLLRQHGRRRSFIDNLFIGPHGFHARGRDDIDCVIVDEAHRLTRKSGMFGNRGENQTAEIINAARFSVFFIDEQQRVTFKDAGSIADIRLFAERAGAQVTETALLSQFRCDGSQSYVDWLDQALGIRSSDRMPSDDFGYDFRVYDDPNKMFEAIEEANAVANRARVVAGYCWEWPKSTRYNPAAPHVVIDTHGFSRPWNLASTDTWAIDPHSVNEVGCVHTSQGLEFDYVGVIVGDDLRFENGRVITDRTERAKTDASLKGVRALAKSDPERAARIADEIIRNTYRVLMTRGMKGCYVFCTDAALARHLRATAPKGGARLPYRPATDTHSIAAESSLED